jgi:hypothetical protein
MDDVMAAVASLEARVAEIERTVGLVPVQAVALPLADPVPAEPIEDAAVTLPGSDGAETVPAADSVPAAETVVLSLADLAASLAGADSLPAVEGAAPLEAQPIDWMAPVAAETMPAADSVAGA